MTTRALVKEGLFDDNFSYSSSKPYVVTHLNYPIEMVQIKGHNICFYAE